MVVPTVQYVAAVKPNYVASVTGVGGTYRGSRVADKIQSNQGTRTFFNILGIISLGLSLPGLRQIRVCLLTLMHP